jgi:SAM-dependent methyltransferase
VYEPDPLPPAAARDSSPAPLSRLARPSHPTEVHVELTGERPVIGATPDSLVALHDAGYREVVARLGPGTVLDVGCGFGDETARLEGDGRMVVGADYDPATAVAAAATFGPGGPRGASVRFLASDGARLAVRSGAIDAVCSSHLIEHFSAPERHVAELARVLRDDGTAFVITPNAPADFENPFHVYLFEPAQLASLLRLFFSDVEVLGIEGDEELKADFARRRASGERLLRLDRFGLRHRIPRRLYVWGYERLLPIVYRMLGSQVSGVGSGLDASHFYVTRAIEPTTPALLAIARQPRRPLGQG